MKVRSVLSGLLALLAVGVVWLGLREQRLTENLRFLRGTIESGILMQMTIDEFHRQFGHAPSFTEFTNSYSFIGSFQQGVTMTNTITSTFNNSGGWFYDAKSGEICINSDR